MIEVLPIIAALHATARNISALMKVSYWEIGHRIIEAR
jgi:hypothetical protein